MDTFFVHSSLSSLAGCYAVTALDRSGNESPIIQKTCVDNCIEFRLPNLITPDRNGLNDRFTPSCVSKAFIENVHFTVYNRWGKVVFEHDVQPEINWSGISEGNSILVTPGIYFYLVEVKAKRLYRKDENMKFTGWIDVQR
jgi:gliding motility-associated-like protein